jgi:transcriptional regulator with XRE-family HTH domain
MKLENANSDQIVLEELGSRLARRRLDRNLTQGELAHEAGVSRATIERLEAGHAVKSSSLIRVLRSLDQLAALDRLVPEPVPSPIERLRLGGRRRQRAAGSRAMRRPQNPEPWTWGSSDE